MHVGHVVFRQQGRHVQINLDTRIQRPLDVGFLAGTQRIDRASEQFRIQREADFLYLAALGVAEQFAGTAYFEVVGGEGKTGPQVLE